MRNNNINRTGGTSRRSGNPPVVFSTEFTPKTEPPAVLDEDGLLARVTSKGFTDADTEEARRFIRRIGYAHASDYFKLFSNTERNELKAVHQAIVFDRRMQSVLMKYIGLFELQFRAQYSYLMAIEGGAFAHRNPDNFKNLTYFKSFLEEYENAVVRQLRSRNGKLTNFVNQYGDAPVWQAVQVVPLGTLSKLYQNTRSKTVRIGGADSFEVRYDVLVSWTRTISYIRNRCAHFARIAGTKLVAVPKRIEGVNLKNTHPFYAVLILEKLLDSNGEFIDDTSPIRSLSLAMDIADVIISTPESVATRCVPANWKSLMSATAAIEM